MTDRFEITKTSDPLITLNKQEWAIAIMPEPGKWFHIGYDGRIDASPGFQPSEAAAIFAEAVGPILAGYRNLRCTCVAATVLHERTCATRAPTPEAAP